MKSRLAILLVVVLALVVSVSFVQAQDDAQIIKIASQSPLSGGQSQLGIGIRNATELAINQLGGPITEMGFEIQFVPFDDQATPDVGVANAQQIVADPAILGLVGHLNSGVAIPSSEVYDANDLVMVSPANTSPTITERGLATVNRVCGRDDLQGPTGAQFASSLEGVESVYIVHDTTAYGQGIAEFFRAEAEVQGLEVLGFEGTEETSNFETFLTPILALNPDLIYMGAIYNQAGIFINQARAAGYEGLFMGPDGFDASDLAELAGEGIIGTYYTSVAGPASLYPNAAQFIEDYTEVYGEAPTPFAAQAYDSAAVVLLGIAQAIEDNGGELPSRADVAAAVRATENYEGLTNTITFDENGDPEVASYYVIEVVSSDPAEWSNNTVISTLQIPSPLHAAEMMEMDTMATEEASS